MAVWVSTSREKLLVASTLGLLLLNLVQLGGRLNSLPGSSQAKSSLQTQARIPFVSSTLRLRTAESPHIHRRFSLSPFKSHKTLTRAHTKEGVRCFSKVARALRVLSLHYLLNLSSVYGYVGVFLSVDSAQKAVRSGS